MNNYITPNETVLDNDSASIQAAVDRAAELGLNQVVIPRINARTGEGKWIIEKTVRLPSDMTVVLDNCFMQMADDVAAGFFSSQNLFTPEGLTEGGKLYNISIIGRGNATLDGGKPTGLGEKNQRERGVPVRLNTPIFFLNVEGFKIENIRITNHRYWGMRFEFCSKGAIKDIYFEGHCDRKNQDGINLRNGCHNILIENIFGQTGDDMIALSAIDRKMAPGSIFEKYEVIVEGASHDIHDITIKNISGAAIHHPLIAMRNHNGAKIYNIVIDNVRDTAQLCEAEGDYKWDYRRYATIVIGSPGYFETENCIGDTYNISISNVFTSYSNAAVYIQCSLKNSVFRNLFVSGMANHAITVEQLPGWEVMFVGVTVENLLIDGVHFSPSDPEGSALLDLAMMRDSDYVKGLIVKNAFIDKAECFAEVAECIKDKFDMKAEGISAPFGLDMIRYSNKRIALSDNNAP